MNRVATVTLGGALGAILGVLCFALYITFAHPNYYRDSGAPPILPGIIFGCPSGFVFGLVVGAIWPLKKHP
jgi:hypothetical protein